MGARLRELSLRISDEADCFQGVSVAQSSEMRQWRAIDISRVGTFRAKDADITVTDKTIRNMVEVVGVPVQPRVYLVRTPAVDLPSMPVGPALAGDLIRHIVVRISVGLPI